MTTVLCLLALLYCADLPLAHSIVAPVVPLREVVIWLDARTAANATWAEWASTMAAHRANVTGASPLLYTIDGAGVFRTLLPNASAVAVADSWIHYMESSVSLRVKPLVLASVEGIVLASTNATVGSALVAATTREAARLGLAGLVLSLDKPGPAALRKPWLETLGEWLGGIGSVSGAQLDLLIPGNCTAGQPPHWLGASCADFRALALNATRPHTNLRVVTEASFGDAPPAAWTAGVNAANHALGPSVTSLGVTYAQPLQDTSNGCLMYALAGGITSLYVKEGLPAGPTADADWASFGYWMTTIA